MQGDEPSDDEDWDDEPDATASANMAGTMGSVSRVTCTATVQLAKDVQEQPPAPIGTYSEQVRLQRVGLQAISYQGHGRVDGKAQAFAFNEATVRKLRKMWYADKTRVNVVAVICFGQPHRG